MAFLGGLFSGANEREIKKMQPVLREVNDLEPEMQALSDDELRAKTDEFRAALQEGETLDTLLPEIIAVAREAIWRKLGQRAFDSQVTGTVVLHQGKIAELKTGEGKTLVAALALYLNALDGKGAHLITVNDYLSKRDAQWYGRVLAWLGVSVGVVQHDASYLVEPRPGQRGGGPGVANTVQPPRGLRRRHAPTAPTTSSASTISATTWRRTMRCRCSAGGTSPSSTRSTTSSSTRRARR